MNRAPLLFLPLAAGLTACGSVVIVPIDPNADAAAPPDAAVPPSPSDAAVPPSPFDAAVPPSPFDAAVPPSPFDAAVPPSPPPGALARACQAFCARGRSVCNITVDCDALCANALAQPGAARCPAEALAMLTCATNRGAFVCRPARNSFELDTAVCAAESAAFMRCSAGPTPPPPPPEPVDPLRAVCARMCDQAARSCRAAPPGCVDSCAQIAVEPGFPMCRTQVFTAYDCLARNGFMCGPMGMITPPRVCADALAAASTCLEGMPKPPPEPPPEPPPPVYPGCDRACSAAVRACGREDPGCLDGCSNTAARLSGACLAAFDSFLACVQTNGFVCRGGTAQPGSACAALTMRVEACLGGTTPSPPPLADAGAPDR